MMILKCFVICAIFSVIFATGRHGAKRASDSIAAQLQTLINEESGLLDQLSGRVRSLREEADNTNAILKTCSCPDVIHRKPKDPSIAYTGTLPSYVSLSTSTKLSFKNDLVNVGQPFNVTSGHFVANVSGLYGFSLSMYMTPGYETSLKLMQNGQPILFTRTGHYSRSSTNRQVNMATNFAVVNVTAGDQIWPQYISGSGKLYADGVTTFSGVLLREM